MRQVHSPTLASVLMVEQAIKRHTGDLGKYQVWKQLPRKMMYQTFQVILAYLEDSGKILLDRDGKIHWTYDPKGVKKILSAGVTLR